jgi:hypothetical protein
MLVGDTRGEAERGSGGAARGKPDPAGEAVEFLIAKGGSSGEAAIFGITVNLHLFICDSHIGPDADAARSMRAKPADAEAAT